MKKKHALLFLAAISCLVAVSSAFAWTATEQDSAYQRSMEHLQAARQALAVAQREVVEAQRVATLPGFDYDRLTREMAAIQQRLDVYLLPATRQERYPAFRPDGIYFNPTYSGD